MCTNRTSIDSHVHWKNLFHENRLSSRIYADFEVDNGM